MTQPQPATPPQDDTLVAFKKHQAEVEFDGATVLVQPLAVGQYPDAADAIQALLPALGLLSVFEDENVETAALIGAVLKLVSQHGNPLFKLLAIVTELPEEKIRGTRDLAALTQLVAAIVRVHLSFFLESAGSVRDGLASVMAAAGVSPMPSTALLPPATA